MVKQNLFAALEKAIGLAILRDQPLARYTAARIGGPADALIMARSVEQLASVMQALWQFGLPHLILGGGSNVLISDAGVRGVVVLNQARGVHFKEHTVLAESGANLGLVARQAAARGLSGLEWAAGIPGTVGGAVVGNAGAHGGEIATHLRLAEILHRNLGRVWWDGEQMAFDYRSSQIKRQPGPAVVLSAQFELLPADKQAIKARMDALVAYRHRTQPPGASMGSMFKNPTGDYAGRLIGAAGLKGLQMGNAQISSLHGNFFVNLGKATAADVRALIQYAQRSVADQFGVQLELEVELMGEW